ncbi:MAG TPA: hypothetical protein VN914_06965 [Polyangia bacterium]|nr:hypothetical protein [Polyangia bacterium]
MRRWGIRWVVFVVAGMLATAASAVVGLRGLAELWRVDELDGHAPAPVLDPGEQGPLLGLHDRQFVRLHYRSQGCFHSIDRIFTFGRGHDGQMQVEVRRMTEPLERDAVQRRLLTEAEVAALDRELLIAQRLRGGECTTRREYELVFSEPGFQFVYSPFANAACRDPELPAGGITLDALATR